MRMDTLFNRTVCVSLALPVLWTVFAVSVFTYLLPESVRIYSEWYACTGPPYGIFLATGWVLLRRGSLRTIKTFLLLSPVVFVSLYAIVFLLGNGYVSDWHIKELEVPGLKMIVGGGLIVGYFNIALTAAGSYSVSGFARLKHV
jgi:hypothetical protein